MAKLVHNKFATVYWFSLLTYQLIFTITLVGKYDIFMQHSEDTHFPDVCTPSRAKQL